ncbi:flippase [Acinetobacter apis]|uniref:Membrane protein involved in the export of O-antigen and teichoic acid n=1 Tax=Acinetobacter apis TaxID=1229165 RepID=A0A217EIB5_9GAMM|nr:oligosaccharide flippase family protein [Acinetobacter apis]SNQ29950.1 Membrane protein involved in the export of O-antigen and teichoic acid [Acinetobacter apis]
MNIVNFFKNKSVINSIWMMLEKIISMFGLIFVMSLVAKYIGPDNFGRLTYASSIFFIVQILAMFGLDGIIFQKTSRNKIQGERIIALTMNLRNIIYVPTSILALLFIYFYTDYLTFIYAICTAVGGYFLLHDVYSIYFNALLMSYINVIYNSVGLVIALILRYIIVKLNFDIEYLGIPIIVVSLIPYLIKRKIYNHSKAKNLLGSNLKHRYQNAVFSIGKKMVLYSVSVAIFLKTSQIILGYFSKHDLGIYTVSITLGTSYYFVLLAIITSFMPEIYNEKNERKINFLVARLNVIVIIISFFAFIGFSIFGKWIILNLYGDLYAEALPITLIMIIVCMFSGLSTVVDKFLLKYNSYSFLMKKTNVLMFFNIFISFVSIYLYGLVGAVLSILLVEFLSATFMNYFFKKVNFLEIHKSLFSIQFYKKILKDQL